MLNKFFLVVSFVMLTASCVSSKIYDDLKNKNKALGSENELLMSQLDKLGGNSETHITASIQNEIDRLKSEKSRLTMDLSAAESSYQRMKESYEALETNSDAILIENLERNRALLAQLEEKERALILERRRLEIMEGDLDVRSKRVSELEEVIALKDAKMNSLKQAISEALTNFEGKGLTIEQRNGKVYVSMENKLLFESGSWDVNTRGREAVIM